MRWTINKDGVNTGEVFDDGILAASPGDPEFTKEKIDAKLKDLGKGHTADWAGVSYPTEETKVS